MGYTIGQDGILRWTDDDAGNSRLSSKFKPIPSRLNPSSGPTPYRRRGLIDKLVRSLHVVNRTLMVTAIILGVLMAIGNNMALGDYISRIGNDMEAISGRLKIPELLKTLSGNHRQSLVEILKMFASPDTLLENISYSIFILYTMSLNLQGLIKSSIIVLFKFLRLLLELPF